MKKRILSTLLCLCMALSLLPAMQLSASAATYTMKGSGTASDPYQVRTGDDINAMVGAPEGTYFRQMNDITETYFVYNQKTDSSPEFNGVFDGAGYKISDIYLLVQGDNGSADAGDRAMFPVVGAKGVLKNLTLTARGGATKIYHEYSGFSFLVHTNYGTIQNVHVENFNFYRSPDSYGLKNVGGLVCYNEASGQVVDCSIDQMTFGAQASGTSGAGGLTGEINMGGFVAVNRGTVERCAIKAATYTNRWLSIYNEGDSFTLRAKNQSCIGGAVGVNYGTVDTVYVGYQQVQVTRTPYLGGDINCAYRAVHFEDGTILSSVGSGDIIASGRIHGLGAVVGENKGGTTTDISTAVYDRSGKIVTADNFDSTGDALYYNSFLVGGDNAEISTNPYAVATDYYNAVTGKTVHYTINLKDKAGNILQSDIVTKGESYTVQKYYTAYGVEVDTWSYGGTTYRAGDVISASNLSTRDLVMAEPILLNQDNWKDYLKITWPSSFTYNGTAKTITLAPKDGQVAISGTATVEYWLRGVKQDSPTDAGEYTLKLTGLTGDNYAFDTGTTEITLGTMNIQTASTTISVSASTGTVKFREFTTLTATLTNGVNNGAPFRGKVVFHVGPTYTFTGSLTSDGTATYTYDWVASSYGGGGYLWAEYVPSEDDCYDKSSTNKTDPQKFITVTKGYPIASDFSYSPDANLNYTYPEAIPITPAGLGITPNSAGWGDKATFNLVFKNTDTGKETSMVYIDGHSTLPGGTYSVWVKNTGTAEWFLADSTTDTGLVLTVNSKAPSRVMFTFKPSTFDYADQSDAWTNVVDEAAGSGLSTGQAAPVYYKDGVKVTDKAVLDAGTYECYGHVIKNSSYDSNEETYLGQITVVKSDISGIAQYMFDVTLPEYTMTTYNGTAQGATLAKKTTGNYSAHTGYGEATLHYYSDEAMTQEVQPINAATKYYVGLMVSGGDNFYATTRPISFGNFMIQRAPLQATLTNPSRYFGQADAEYEITLTGFPEGKDESDLQAEPYVYFSPNDMTLGSKAGEYAYSLMIDDPNYYLVRADGNAEKFTIKALDTQELTIEGIPSVMVVGESFSPRLTYQGQALYATFTSTDPSVLVTNGGSAIRAVSPGSITLTGVPSYDYQAAKTAIGTFEITVVAKSENSDITVTFPEGDASLPYTGAGIKYEEATLTGAPEGSTLTYSYVVASEYNNTGVLKDGLPLEVGKYIVTATYTAGDGSAIRATKALTITPAVLQVEVGSFQWTQDYYGDIYKGKQKGELKITGIVPGDDIAVTVSGLPVFPDANVSTNPQEVTVNLFLEGADTYKYTLAQKTIKVPGIINPIGTRLSGVFSVYGTYGTKLSELTTSGYVYPDNDNRAVLGKWSYDAEDDLILKPGNTREFTMTFTPNSSNYKPLTVKVTPQISPVSYSGDKSVTKTVYLSGPVTGKVLDLSSTLKGITGATITAVQLGTTNDFVTRAYLNEGKIVIDANDKTGYSSTIKACITSDDYADFTLTITVKGLAKTDAGVSFTDDPPATATYGDKDFAIAATATTVGESAGVWTWKSSDDTVLSVSGNTATATVTVLKAGDATITATYESENVKGSVSETITVSPRAVTVTVGDYKVSKVYDGTLAAGIGSGDLAVTGIKDSTVKVTATPVAYTNANVGGQNTMTVTLALTGEGKDNYILGSVTTLDVPCKITPAALTTTGTANATANYGTAVKDITNITGLTAKLGETTVAGSWAFANSATAVPNVGDRTAFTATFTPDHSLNAQNYQPLTQNIVPTITKVTYPGDDINVTAWVPANFAKNGVTVDMSGYITGIPGAAVKRAAVRFNDSGLIAADSVTTDGNVVSFDTTSVSASAGDAITVIISSTNYNDFEAVITLQTVELDDAEVSFPENTPTTKTYGDPTFTLTAQKTAEGDGVWTWSSSDPAVLAVSGTDATATVTVKKPGSAFITARYESDTALGSAQTASITVGKAALTVQAIDLRITLGNPAPSLTNPVRNTDYTVTGLVGTDTEPSVIMEYQQGGKTVNNVDTGKAGTYDIVVKTVSAVDSSYYTVVMKPGKLTISPVPVIGGDSIFYPITAGENGKYTIGSIHGLSFTSAGALTKFRSAAVDGKTLDAKTYTLKGDSIVLSLTTAYLDTLSVGTHSLRIEFSDGYSTANFTISKKAIVKNPFVDLHDSDYFYNAVLWAVEEEITSGTSPTTFSPNNDCTRAQAVTFLWRAMGEPEPTQSKNPFSDVSESAYYYKAVLWAVGKGITEGTSATRFSPEETCTRSQVITFLWRAQENPTVNYAMSFTDVPADSYYTEAVRWAVSEGITSGTSETTFSPIADCNRAQAVTFLFRCLGK